MRYCYSVDSPTDVLCYNPESPVRGFMPLSTDENAAYVKYIEALNAARKEGVRPINYPKPPVFGQPQPVAKTESVPETPAKPKSKRVKKVAVPMDDIDTDAMKELINGTDSL